MKSEVTYATAISKSGNQQDNGCVIVALSVALNKEYDEVADRLRMFGKRDNRGTSHLCLLKAVYSYGFKLKRIWVHDQIKELNKNCKKNFKTLNTSMVGRYPDAGWNATGHAQIWYTRTHALAVKNGKVEDWTATKNWRVQEIFDLVPNS